MKTPHIKTLHLDCSSGLGGDMLLAGLVDLGLDLRELETALQGAGLEITLSCRTATRLGVSGTILEVRPKAKQHLRRLEDIQAILQALRLSELVKKRSAAAFERLAQVEAQAHGASVQEIHFHEIGAADTIVDIVGAFWGLEALDVWQITASALPWFSGRVVCEHGILPLPVPAVVELLKNKPVYPTAHQIELITPTGALLLDQIVTQFQHGPQGVLLGCGIGVGTMELAEQPNVLRCFLMDATNSPLARDQRGSRGRPPCLPDDQINESSACSESVVVLETNIDHLTGEEIGACFEALLQAGALDVLFLPGVMKKNRPGGLIQVLCRPGDIVTVRQAVFEYTMTLGLRQQTVQRVVLHRKTTTQSTSLGTLPVKETRLGDKVYFRPEFEALQQLAKRTGRSVAQLRYLLQSQTKDSG
jgi:uncharacterized protein (TIGR00299 family) protein